MNYGSEYSREDYEADMERQGEAEAQAENDQRYQFYLHSLMEAEGEVMKQQQDLALELSFGLDSHYAICYIDKQGNRTETNAYEIEGQIRGILEEMGCVIVKVGKSPTPDIDNGDLPF